MSEFVIEVEYVGATLPDPPKLRIIPVDQELPECMPAVSGVVLVRGIKDSKEHGRMIVYARSRYRGTDCRPDLKPECWINPYTWELVDFEVTHWIPILGVIEQEIGDQKRIEDTKRFNARGF